MAIRLIRANNATAVTAYDDAVVFHSAKGHDYTGDKRGGVFDRVHESFNRIVDNVNRKLIVKSGMGMLYGRQFELPPNETVEFITADKIYQYIVIYVEVKVQLVSGEEQATVSLKLQYSSQGYPSLGNTDLIANRYGIATMELYRLKTDGSGRIMEITDRRYIYIPGYAEKARMMSGDGVINGREVNKLVFPDKDQARHTDHAYYADYAKSLGGTGYSAFRNAINDSLYMVNRDAFLVTAKEIMLIDENASLNPGTHNIVITIPSGNIIGALIYGSTNINVSGFYQAQPGATPLLSMTTASPHSTQNWQVSITVNNTQVTIVNTNITVSGSLYLVLLMLGTR